MNLNLQEYFKIKKQQHCIAKASQKLQKAEGFQVLLNKETDRILSQTTLKLFPAPEEPCFLNVKTIYAK